MIRHRKNNENDIIYTTINNIENNDDIENENNDEEILNSKVNDIIINYQNIDTLVFSVSEMYILSVLGYIDRLLTLEKINIKNIKNYVSSSFATIICLYLSFQYEPKEILKILYNNLTFVNDNIFNISNTFGIFEITYFVNKLLEPLYYKLGFVPTLKDINTLTNSNCIFIGYNFTKSKVTMYSYKTHPFIKIDEIIQKCCIVPFLFKKYTNNNTNDNNNIDIEDIHIDYSLIDNREYDYAIKLFNKSKILLLKTTVIYDEEYIDIKTINIFEYAKNIFETIQNRENEFINTDNNMINININKYNKMLLFDEHIKYKEYINLFLSGYNYMNDNHEKSNYIKQYDKITCNINNNEIYEGMVIAGGGTNVFNLVGGIKYCIENKKIDINKINTYIGTSAGSYVCTMLALGFKIEDVIDVYINDISSKLNFNFKNINISDRINDKSIYSNKTLIESYETVFIKYNDGQIPSLLDIKNNYGKNIIYTVYNLTKNKLEYLNYENSPELLVTHACAMSSCIPFVFNPIEYNKCFYIDGGIKSNYSIEITELYKNIKFIGFGLTFLSNYVKMNLFEFLFYFIFENSRKYQITKIKNSTNCDTYCMNIVYDDDRDGEALLVVNKNIVNKYMDKGYKYMKNNIKIDF